MSSQELINFTRGVPAPESFPLDDLSAAAQRAIGKYGKTILQYGKSYGFRPLIEWLAEWKSVEPEQVITANGSLQLFDFFCSHFLQPGDAAFVEAPTYDRAITTLRHHQADVVGIPLQSDGLDIDALEAELKKRVPKLFYVIPDFQNPAGMTYSLEKRQRLVDLADAYDFWIVEDAPYRPLRFRGEDQPALFDLNAERVLHMLSFSKLIGPGPRIGFAMGDANLLQSVAKIAEDTYITPSLLSQGIVYEFLNAGLLPAQVEKLKALYAPRLDATLAALDKHLPDAQATRPDGGFFLSVTLPEGVTTEAVRQTAREKYNLNLASGQAFFPNGGGERFIRLPYCGMSPEVIDDGVARLAAAVADAGS